MNRFALLSGLFAASWWTASGQGTVNFQNVSTALVSNSLTMAPLPVGTAFRVALYYLPDSAVPPTTADFDARGIVLGAPANIGPVAGRFAGGTRSTPGAPAETAWFQARLWETAFGATYEAAVNNFNLIGGRYGLVGTSNIMRVTTGDPTATPPTVPTSLPFIGFALPMIPEPSALGLALLGVCAWLLTRRRQVTGDPEDRGRAWKANL